MLFAERHRKLGRHGSLAHDRAENLLTSTAFQLLRYLPLDLGLLPVLKRVRSVRPDGRVDNNPPAWLNLADINSVKYKFWPRWGPHGEPDVVITLFAGENAVGRIVVEVKLDSAKSGSADVNGDVEVPNPDQLRKYWRGLQARGDGIAGLGVVYLTAHPVPPTQELFASLSQEAGDWLGWLSWQDVWRVVHESIHLPARDLAEILAAKDLSALDGFGMCKAPILGDSPHFWLAPESRSQLASEPTAWFSNIQSFPPRASPLFWKESTH